LDRNFVIGKHTSDLLLAYGRIKVLLRENVQLQQETRTLLEQCHLLQQENNKLVNQNVQWEQLFNSTLLLDSPSSPLSPSSSFPTTSPASMSSQSPSLFSPPSSSWSSPPSAPSPVDDYFASDIDLETMLSSTSPLSFPASPSPTPVAPSPQSVAFASSASIENSLSDDIMRSATSDWDHDLLVVDSDMALPSGSIVYPSQPARSASFVEADYSDNNNNNYHKEFSVEAKKKGKQQQQG
jgi:hypothetical protein